MISTTQRHHPRPSLEAQVAQLETELRLYKQLKLTDIERRINALLDELDDPATPQTKGQRLKERLGIIAATVAMCAMVQTKADIPLIFQQPTKQEQVSPKFSSSSAPSLAGGSSTNSPPITKPVAQPSFADKVRQVARAINADAIDLLTLMSFETAGTLSPSQTGPYVPGQGRAIGLIQFMPATAAELGTSTEALGKMSPVEQLDFVQRYLLKRGFKGGGLKQLYSTVFAGHPNARGSISDGYHTLDSAVERMQREHRSVAEAILSGKSAIKFASTKAIIATWSEHFQRDPAAGDTIAGYTVTSPRGMRTHPVTGIPTMHQGVDLATPTGTKIYAIANGTIECDYWADAGKVGMFTSDSFPGLRFDLLHLDSCPTQLGAKRQVKMGEIIGTTGSFGTGPHLHLAIKALDSGNFLRVRAGWLHWFVTGREPI